MMTLGGELAAGLRELSLGGLGDSPRRFLSALRDELRPIAGICKNDPSRFRWMLRDRGVAFACFSLKREYSGMITLLTLHFPLLEVKGDPAVGDPEIITHIGGLTTEQAGAFVYFFYEHLDDPSLSQINPDLEDDAILRGVDAQIDRERRASAAMRAETTATTDVAVIEAAGVRWLRKLPAYNMSGK
jgi:hypothetical protein